MRVWGIDTTAPTALFRIDSEEGDPTEGFIGIAAHMVARMPFAIAVQDRVYIETLAGRKPFHARMGKHGLLLLIFKVISEPAGCIVWVILLTSILRTVARAIERHMALPIVEEPIPGIKPGAINLILREGSTAIRTEGGRRGVRRHSIPFLAGQGHRRSGYAVFPPLR
jgi:hypothetical protein